MKLPNINCKIQVLSAVNPSEDPEKIKKSISNILPCCNILSENSSIIAESNDVQSLEKIYESVYSTKSQRVLQRQLDKHIDKNSTWFYLNKQAAFVDRVVVCEDADESPLGPLKIILTSSNIERIIDMLVLGH
jgi:predicted RNA binding protein with dsRBD fold (UPF0201 family)